jgi:hypothetical protein
MSKLKVNELDTESGTTITVTTGKTVSVPAGATLDVSAATLTLPATLPATAGTNITSIPGANITGTIPAAALSNVALGPLEDDIAVLGFQVAAASDLAKYSLRDQIVDTFQDTSGVDASASTNEIRDSSGKFYSGGTLGAEQTVVKSYTGANQTFVVPASVSGDLVNFIAWGGAGGGGNAAIGGGGGFIEGDVTVVGGETLNVKVGGGGLINHSSASNPGGGGGGSGIYRSSTVLAIAGGGGAGENAVNGGAGGGTTGANGAGPGIDANGGTQSAGGAAVDGGGAGSLNQGGNAVSSSSTAAGGYNGGGSGDGDNIAWTSGGGGGGYYGGGSGGATGSNHGSGGGGSSLTAGTNTQASGGTTPQTGHTNYAAGTGNGVANSAGQHGHAVIKYTEVTVANLTLISTATTAEAGTTATGDFVILYTPITGSTVLNTNLKAYVSRDNGTTYTQATLTGKGSYSGTTEIATAHDLDISGQPAGVTMRWKIETLVQSAALDTRINGVSLGWS